MTADDNKKITFHCHICNKRIIALQKKAGRQFNCPQCGELLMVPFEVTPSVALIKRPVQAPPKEPTIKKQVTAELLPAKVKPKTMAHSQIRIVLIVLAVIGGILWGLGTKIDYVAYLGIPLLWIPAALILCNQFRSWIPLVFGLVVTAMCLYGFGRNDHYVEHWQEREMRITDTCNRWTQKSVKRRTILYSDEVAALSNNINEILAMGNGPMKNGASHGEWEIVVFSPKIDTARVWYWYGEVVTQGQWQINNK